MKAVITVIGKDNVGIIAKVSSVCAEYGVNIHEVSQTVLSDYFAMILVVDIQHITVPFTDFVGIMEESGKSMGLDIRTMHEDIFGTMHHI